MDHDLLRGIGASVQRLRESQGFSLDELAARSALSARFLGDIVAGRGNVSVVRLARLARALGCSASQILAEAERAAPAAPGVVALLGVRGAGKSTIGPRLAVRLAVPFVELDALVEEQAGLSLSEIFATHGEAYFRRLEVEALRRFLASTPRAVVATGGGIIENPDAWNLLETDTVTVWLRAGTDAHWTRVITQGDRRPMAGRPAAKAELRRLLVARAPLYRRARHHVDTERLGIDGSVRLIAERVEQARGSETSAPARSPRRVGRRV